MKLKNLFNVEICKNPISKDFVEDNPGNVAYVTTTSENNGIDGYVNYPAQYDGNVITVSKDGASADAFYQSSPFCGNEKVMVLVPNIELTPIQMMFYTYVISHNKFRFAYGRKCSVERLNDLEIPSISDIPSWISKYKITPITTKNKKGKSIDLKINTWKEFPLIKIFTKIESGKVINASELEEGNEIPYLGAKKNDNGVMQLCVDIPEKKSKGNCVVMICDGEGSVGYANYMDKDFLGTVNLMLGYNSMHMNSYIGLFLATVISLERPKYSFGRKWKTHIPETIIKLPVDSNDEPDWQFMENYIKSLPYGDRI